MIKLLIIAISFLNPQVQRDSIGVETINGKLFVIHKVGEKETLYAISRRYRTTVDAILQYNPTANNSLEVGQILKVPYVAKSTIKPQTTAGGLTHVVAERETLFSIARAYGVSVDELKTWNNLTSNTLSLGQELVIKKRGVVTATTTQTTTSNNANEIKNKKGAHTVTAKETMYSIARQYGITVQQLKDWNNLQGNEISIGQVLFVAQPEQGVTMAKQTQTTPTSTNTSSTSVATTTNPAVTETRTSENQQVNTEVKNEVKGQETQPVKETVRPKESTITISEAVRGSDEIQESGLAELIEGTDGNRKYLALHRTAPIGTILKVKNEMNNREVFVRVMGKLPEAVGGDKLIIKVSKSAYDRLGAIDQRFRVQVTYYK
jgi:LysM repeat protein